MNMHASASRARPCTRAQRTQAADNCLANPERGLVTGFIIYDTYMIITRLGVDDYVLAAIELYLDFINLFLFVLQCLSLTNNQ